MIQNVDHKFAFQKLKVNLISTFHVPDRDLIFASLKTSEGHRPSIYHCMTHTRPYVFNTLESSSTPKSRQCNGNKSSQILNYNAHNSLIIVLVYSVSLVLAWKLGY